MSTSTIEKHTEKYTEIREAMNTLLASCDGAKTQDGIGFNKIDAVFARDLARCAYWTPKQANAIYNVLRKYKQQLITHDIDIESIEEPALEEDTNPELEMDLNDYLDSLQWDEGRIVATKYGEKFVQNAKRFPHDWWNYWNKYKAEIKKKGISVSKYQGDWQIAKWSDAPNKEEDEKDLITPEDVSLKYENLLLDYQVKHVKYLIASMKNFNSALDASDTGTGKTFSALAVCKELGFFPIVVTPKAVIPSFRKVMKDHFQIDGFVINYEQYKAGKTEYCSVEYDEKGRKAFKWDLPENHLLIVDECHKIKHHDTQNTKMIMDAFHQDARILLMSATMGANPMNMYAVGTITKIFKGRKGFWSWVHKHGCYRNGWGGYEFDGRKEHLISIHNQLYPKHGSRIRISELGDAFPETMIISDAYDMNSNAKKIQEAYRQMQAELEALAYKEEEDSESHLTILLRARQRIELLKTPTLIEMAKDHREEGNRVAIFVNFNETAKAIAKELNCPMIYGGNKKEERQEIIDKFQNNELDYLVCNIRAGGVGISLHDEKTQETRISLISPSWSAEDLKQALGRVHRAGGGKSIQKLVFCAGTVEEDVAKRVDAKIKNIGLLNDGDLQ